MNRDVHDLRALLKPPVSHIDSHVDWQRVESQLGVVLPVDYKAFVETYGTGAIGEMPIWIFNAVANDLAKQNDVIAGTYATLFDEAPLPFATYPTAGGLLYCGSTGNGDNLHWLTEGEPNTWRIVVFVFGDCEFRDTGRSLIRLICDIVKHTETSLFPP